MPTLDVLNASFAQARATDAERVGEWGHEATP